MNEQVINVPAQFSGFIFGQTAVASHASRDASSGTPNIDITAGSKPHLSQCPDQDVKRAAYLQVKQVSASFGHIQIPSGNNGFTAISITGLM